MTAQELKDAIRNVPDFPVKGIQFKDITTALDKPECLCWMRDKMVETYKNKGITKVVGIESRGFILAPAVAMEIGAGFVPVRKPGKLPAETVEVGYGKGNGMDVIQNHKGAINENGVVLIHDDILATGGTMDAAIQLVKKMGVKTIYVDFILELVGLNGRALLEGKADELNCLFDMEVDE